MAQSDLSYWGGGGGWEEMEGRKDGVVLVCMFLIVSEKAEGGMTFWILF